MKTSALPAAMLASLFLVAPSLAQSPGSPGQQGSGSVPAGTGRQEQSAGISGTAGHRGSDVLSASEFVRLAASNSMFETETAKLALERSRDERQRSFAQEMIRAHDAAQKELRGVVGGAGVSGVGMPQALAEQHRTWMDQLRAVQGDDFQALYAQQQAQSHLIAIDLFRNYSQVGDNDALKRWAASRLPTLQNHFREAQALKGGAP